MGWSGGSAWQGVEPCPLRQVDLAAHADGDFAAVDNAAHLLWHRGRSLPCDREIEALALWQGHVLTLSSDTDCLSIADKDGWLVTAKAGMYPQDMALTEHAAYVCGGADGLVHALSLPELRTLRSYPVPGMPERIALWRDAAWLLCLFAEGDELQSGLCHLALPTGELQQILRFSGLPGDLLAYDDGIWCAVSERLYHFPHDAKEPDVTLEGFGLIRHMVMQGDALLVSDPVEGFTARVTGTSVQILTRGADEPACP